ncbi:MAG: heme-binding protein [Fuerstiella sp.]
MLFRKLISSLKDADDCIKRTERYVGIEQLEDRLCLGGLGTIPVPMSSPAVDGTSASDAGLVQSQVTYQAASENSNTPISIRYDFRDESGFQNLISVEQQRIAVIALNEWSDATNHRYTFERDTESSRDSILNIGVGDLLALDYESRPGAILGLGGSQATNINGQSTVHGTAWLDALETWDTQPGNGNRTGTHDFFTVVAHEVGHALGYQDTIGGPGIMNSQYTGALTLDAIAKSVQASAIPATSIGDQTLSAGSSSFEVGPLADPQITSADVKLLLDRATAATPSEDAIIAIVDRNGTILGVRTETGVVAPNDQILSFMIDGAVAKARTAAFFANDTAPLTSRTVRFISQSTITQREVEADPNSTDPTTRGPGFVAPIGLGGHFPPEIRYTPPVDLFAIEHNNRDSLIHAGANGIRENGGGDDITLSSRFDADFLPGKEILAPESYGFASGLALTQQSRGIATLPGGIPLFRDADNDGFGDTLVGGIGVFFPGPDGFATHEQGFVAQIGQTETERTNSPLALEAEYIALAAAGGSLGAASAAGHPAAKVGDLAGLPPVVDLDLPFGNITLVGIELEIIGPTPGIQGVRDLTSFGINLGIGTINGTDHLVSTSGDFYLDGSAVPEGWLVAAKSGVGITAAEVEQIITQSIAGAEKTRAAIRLPIGSRTNMAFAVTDKTGDVLGLYRMPDATVFSIDVAVAKARNTAYYADAAALQPEDQLPGVATGVAFTNRTFRFLAEPRFPSGIEGTTPPAFSTLNTTKNPNINVATAENIGAPVAASEMNDTVLGYDAFNPGTNFRDASTPLEHQNGIVFFPGSTPLYKNGKLIGGFGVSGDGVDQDDVVSFIGAQGFLPQQNGAIAADEVFVDGVRLPYIKFLRNPFA